MTEALAYDIEKAVEVDTLEVFEPLWDDRRAGLKVGSPPHSRLYFERPQMHTNDPKATYGRLSLRASGRPNFTI